MKIFLLIAALIVIVSAYRTSYILPPELFGKWEARKQYRENIIMQVSAYTPGNGNILELNSDSTYKRYIQGKLAAEGVFRIKRNAYRIDQNYYNELYFDDETTFKSLISIVGDKLIIKPLISDAEITAYQKIQD